MNTEMPSENKEETFQSWLSEFHGRYWLNPDVMGEDVYSAAQMYVHWLAHEKELDSPEVVEASDRFKELTGYDVKDFIDFEDKLNQELKSKEEE